jgi:putative transposase
MSLPARRSASVSEDKIWLVSFMHYDLGFFDPETGRVECADNPFEAKLLPLSSE